MKNDAAARIAEVMSDKVFAGTVVLPDRVIDDGHVLVADGLVQFVGSGPAPAGEKHGGPGFLVLPGAIDAQVHSRSQKGQEDFIWSTRSAAPRRHGEYGSRAVSRPARPPGPRRRSCRAQSPAPPTRSLGRPDAGLPDDQHILMVFDPITGDELGKRMVPLAV